jgi:hypothetical protein
MTVVIELKNEEFLEQVRMFARQHARKHGSVTTDDLHEHANTVGIEPTNYNAWGAVFAGGDWQPIGRIASRRPASHGRHIRIWGLKDKWRF